MPSLNAKGQEVLDQTPIARPVGFQRPPTMQEMIRMYVRRELSAAAAAEGHETFEEADDLDVGEDYDPSSPWELSADQEEAQFVSHPVETPVAPTPKSGSAPIDKGKPDPVPSTE